MILEIYDMCVFFVTFRDKMLSGLLDGGAAIGGARP